MTEIAATQQKLSLLASGLYTLAEWGRFFAPKIPLAASNNPESLRIPAKGFPGLGAGPREKLYWPVSSAPVQLHP